MKVDRRRRLASITLLVLSCGFTSCSCGEQELIPQAETPDGEPEVREIVFTAAPPEISEPSLLGGPAGATVRDIMHRLAAAARDEDARGVLLRVGPMGGGWARLTEVHTLAEQVRAAGKPLHCHFDMTDNVGFLLLARSCDRISMTPAGSLDLIGVSAHLFHAREMLDRIGIQADLLQVGRYKGARDPVTETEASPEVRASMGQLVDDLMQALVDGIAEGRDLSPEQAAALIDQGPFGSEAALQAGLVDDIGFEDEARQHIRTAAGVRRVRRIRLSPAAEPVGLGEILAALAGEPPEESERVDRVALVHLEGSITDVDQGGTGGGRSTPFVNALRRFRNDDSVKAVLLRIDSPGGSALASDRMWHAVRQVASKKPVIVSVGDMAASGGYYIASGGTEIFAHRTSLVGSIGVVGGKIVFADLAERLGVNLEVIARGEHAAYTSPTRPFTPEERSMLNRSMHRTYSRFLRRILTGRELDRERLDAAAEGRIMTGGRALTMGLVDQEGGLFEALARARELGGLGEHTPVETWPRPVTLLDAIAAQTGAGPQDGDTRSLHTLAESELHGSVYRSLGLSQTLGPIGRGILESTRIVHQERVSVSLPFGLLVR